MSNEGTKQQFKTFFDKVIDDFKNPDQRKVVKQERLKRKKKVSEGFGL